MSTTGPYPHMCRDGHPEIGHAVSDDDERCLLCRAIDERDDRSARLSEADAARAEMLDALATVGIGRSDECGDDGAMVEWFATTENGEQGCGSLVDALQMLTAAAEVDGQRKAEAAREAAERERDALPPSEAARNTAESYLGALVEDASDLLRAWAANPTDSPPVYRAIGHLRETVEAIIALRPTSEETTDNG